MVSLWLQTSRSEQDLVSCARFLAPSSLQKIASAETWVVSATFGARSLQTQLHLIRFGLHLKIRFCQFVPGAALITAGLGPGAALIAAGLEPGPAVITVASQPYLAPVCCSVASQPAFAYLEEVWGPELGPGLPRKSRDIWLTTK